VREREGALGVGGRRYIIDSRDRQRWRRDSQPRCLEGTGSGLTSRVGEGSIFGLVTILRHFVLLLL